ncbi:MAG: shikimate kinase [Bacteroidota bacterium]
MPPRIYLTGFMASGKSTVGPLLADALGYRFVDLDWLVEAQTGMSIPDLFAKGERAFRSAERRALEETVGGVGSIVSTGGGTLVDPEAFAVARAAGPVVWLRASVDTVLDRIGTGEGRPMLRGIWGRPLRGEKLRQRVMTLLALREPFYAQADLAVDASAPAEVVAREIAEALPGWQRQPPGG